MSAAALLRPPEPLVFTHESRTFTAYVACRDGSDPAAMTGTRRAAARMSELWWWFEVSGDQQRYAPFRMDPGAKETSIRAAMIAYYLNLLVRRAEKSYGRFGRPRPADAAADASAAPAVAPTTPTQG